MYRAVNVVCIFLQVIIHVPIMHKHRSLQLSHNIHLPQPFHWKHCLLYNHTLLKIKKGNWQSTMKNNMSSRYAFKKAMSSDNMYLTQIHFHLYNTSGEQKTLFPIAPLEYRQNIPLSICVHILSSDWVINNMTSIDAFKNIDKNLYIFASQYYV